MSNGHLILKASGHLARHLVSNHLVVGGAPVITMSSLPAAQKTVAYSVALTATGSSSYAWSVLSGSFPPGLSLDGTGNITGTPTSTGSYSFVVQVQGYNGLRSSQAYTLTVTVARLSIWMYYDNNPYAALSLTVIPCTLR